MGKFDPPTTSPVAYGYARVSHVNSFDKGESLPSQEQRITKYYDNNLKKEGVKFAGVLNDGRNISAFKVPFWTRPAGREILSKINKGDHIILDKVDRIWRSLEDFVNLMKRFNEMEITVHIVNFLGSTIQNNTPMGKFMLQQFVLMGELESTIKSERIREALHVLKKKGQSTGYHVPPGCRVRKHKAVGSKKMISTLYWSEKERSIMAEIVRLIDDECLVYHHATPLIEDFIAKLENRPPRRYHQYRDLAINVWPRFYKYEVAYKYLNITKPSEIPKREFVYEAARQHKRERTTNRGKTAKSNYNSLIPQITPQDLIVIADRIN